MLSLVLAYVKEVEQQKPLHERKIRADYWCYNIAFEGEPNGILSFP